ncbi:uncharacterized protein LOC124939889 [Impatiens glandulifera]|uniref:uncharacterized protein LOC124939889 n=1 Tax=Impatiens glandulifera TaxID=253017 RepID=UPI001FB0C9A4|nr:uncharacterized protein LOC124939889 [Impatiens glandulifera]
MASSSIAFSPTPSFCRKFNGNFYRHTSRHPRRPLLIVSKHQQNDSKSTLTTTSSRREVILKTSEIAMFIAILNFSGKKPNYLGIQKNPPGLALCPATQNCVSTSENITDLNHYAPPWNYNPDGKRGNITREKAIEELLQVIKSTKVDKSNPRIIEKKDDYLYVEYSSPILKLVDDVEFWFPPGKKPIVQYRSASRVGSFDFDANKKRIKALRLQLEKKGWASENSF